MTHDNEKLSDRLSDVVGSAFKKLAPIYVRTVNPATANATNSKDKNFCREVAEGEHLREGSGFLNGA